MHNERRPWPSIIHICKHALVKIVEMYTYDTLTETSKIAVTVLSSLSTDYEYTWGYGISSNSAGTLFQAKRGFYSGSNAITEFFLEIF